MKSEEVKPPDDEHPSTIRRFFKSIHVATPGTLEDLRDKEALPPMDSNDERGQKAGRMLECRRKIENEFTTKQERDED